MALEQPTVSSESWAAFMALRADLFAAIKASLEQDGHCKSYEGQLTIGYQLPNYFVDSGPTWMVSLACYVIGPSRHYEWFGDSFEEALEKCEADVREWIAEAADEE
jgi:hypothetical protein